MDVCVPIFDAEICASLPLDMAHQKLPVLGLLCLYCTLQLPPALSIPLAQFYPFGSEAGDSELPSNDDGSAGPITLSSPFPFFGRAHTTLYVCYFWLYIAHRGMKVSVHGSSNYIDYIRDFPAFSYLILRIFHFLGTSKMLNHCS